MSQAPTPTAEERSQEILASIRQVFAEKGFDGASMQDLARAAGMSVGNFYRYFPSKAAIVQSMCGMDMQGIQQDFAAVQASDAPLQCLRERFLRYLGDEATKDGQLWAEVTAASTRKPEIGAVARQMEEGITAFFAAVFSQISGRSIEEARARYEGECQILILLVKGIAIRSAQFGPPGPALARTATEMVDAILTKISNDKAEG